MTSHQNPAHNSVPSEPDVTSSHEPSGDPGSGKPELFSLGQVVATPGALALLEQQGVTPMSLLDRHVRGDWGDLGADDRKHNDAAVLNGARIFSAYSLKKASVWIITEAVGDADADEPATRASTCILLPAEY